MRQELRFYDMAACFGPSEIISENGMKDKWRILPYRNGNIRGNMLSAIGTAFPEDISFDPKLEGWYKIYIGVPETVDQEIHLKLTDDKGFYRHNPLPTSNGYLTSIEESLWRCADMTGQSIILTRKDMQPALNFRSVLSSLRFVPMDEQEVQAWKAAWADPKNRTIYATDDIHNRIYENEIFQLSDWDSVVIPYADSDVEWLSMEDIEPLLQGRVPGGKVEDFAFLRGGDAAVQRQLEQFDSVQVLGRLVEKGHEMGLKMSVSLRMGAWGMGYPFDQMYLDSAFFMENRHLACVTRDGVGTASLSYAFPEVQDYMISRLVTLAATGCDALTLISHRGGPYLMFEQPVVDRFQALYGEDPRTLPLDEPRLSQLHCEIMAEFFRKLRSALDAACPDRHVQIHLRTMSSIYDTRYYALDCEQLAKEGLVDALICYPQRYRERLKSEYFANGHYDVEKYSQYVYSTMERPFIRDYDTVTPPKPYPDSQGVPQGPESVAECCAQWMALEETYGVKVYMEIMPRVMPPEEMRTRALELYDAGIKRIALWDTYGRVPCSAMWALTRWLGHKEELKDLPGPFFTSGRVKELCGLDITRCHPCWGG